MSDINIKKHLTNLEKEYYNLKKHEKRGSPADLEKQKIFKAKLVLVFWIGIPDLRDTILKDKKRSDKDKAEDLKFLDDQERHRKIIIGTEDKKYGRKTRENIRKKTFKRKYKAMKVTLNPEQELSLDNNDNG